MGRNKIIANFTGVTAFMIMSKLLGFLREILFAAYIGTSRVADAFLPVFSVPSQLFTSVGMALSSVNIPNLTGYISNKSKEERQEYVSNLFAQITVFASMVSAAGIVLAPVIARIIAPGLENDVKGIAVILTRIMFPTLVFINLAYITAGILQVHKHFLASTIISIPFNIVIIASLLIWKGNIIVLGVVTTLGWLLQFLIQLPVLLKEKYRFGFCIDFKNEHTKAVFTQMAPILLGNAVFQLCLLTDRAFASYLGEGHTSAIHYGSTLFMTITSVFIVAMSTVTFPDLSRYCIEKDYEKLRGLITYIFKVLFLILVPYLIIVAVYNRDIIRIVYERGSFDAESTGMSSTAFLIYSFCIAGYVSQEIFNRLYYALKKYKVPMFLSLGCVSLNLVLVLLFYKRFGIIGTAGSTAFSFLIYAVVMGIMVKKEIGGLFGKDFAIYIARLIVPCAGMLIVFLVFKHLELKGTLRSFIMPLCAGGLVYLVLSYFMGILKEILLKRGLGHE